MWLLFGLPVAAPATCFSWPSRPSPRLLTSSCQRRRWGPWPWHLSAFVPAAVEQRLTGWRRNCCSSAAAAVPKYLPTTTKALTSPLLRSFSALPVCGPTDQYSLPFLHFFLLLLGKQHPATQFRGPETTSRALDRRKNRSAAGAVLSAGWSRWDNRAEACNLTETHRAKFCSPYPLLPPPTHSFALLIPHLKSHRVLVWFVL